MKSKIKFSETLLISKPKNILIQTPNPRCPQDSPHKAGYSPKHNVVWVCSNLIFNPFEFRRLVAHELIHAFDFARAKIDATNLNHVACSEVRAHNLSGECELWTKAWEYFGGRYLGERQRWVVFLKQIFLKK